MLHDDARWTGNDAGRQCLHPGQEVSARSSRSGRRSTAWRWVIASSSPVRDQPAEPAMPACGLVPTIACSGTAEETRTRRWRRCERHEGHGLRPLLLRADGGLRGSGLVPVFTNGSSMSSWPRWSTPAWSVLLPRRPRFASRPAPTSPSRGRGSPALSGLPQLRAPGCQGRPASPWSIPVRYRRDGGARPRSHGRVGRRTSKATTSCRRFRAVRGADQQAPGRRWQCRPGFRDRSGGRRPVSSQGGSGAGPYRHTVPPGCAGAGHRECSRWSVSTRAIVQLSATGSIRSRKSLEPVIRPM